jgi:hypothetical protein
MATMKKFRVSLIPTYLDSNTCSNPSFAERLVQASKD